jgi:hypothetical protein
MPKNMIFTYDVTSEVDPDPFGSASFGSIRILIHLTNCQAKLYFFQKISIYCKNLEKYATYDSVDKDKTM